MKLLLVTGLYPPNIGGPATYAKLVNDELTNRGHDVEVISFDSVRKFPKVIRHIIFFFKVLDASSKCDLIYTLDPVSVGYPCALVSKITQKRLILRVPGDYAWEQSVQRFGVEDNLDEFLLKTYSKKVEKFRKVQKYTADVSDIIIVPSEYLKSVVMKWGIEESKIKVIYNSVDVEDVKVRKSEDIVFLSAGRLVPWKGFATLIDIFHEIGKQYPNVKLRIAGSGPQHDVLQSKIGDSSNIVLVGQLEKEKLYREIKSASYFILNTSYEGLSHQLIEAMKLETPILTSNVGGNPELIENMHSGILFEYDNYDEIKESIIKAINNAGEFEMYARRAKEKSEIFNVGRMIDELINVFEI